MKTLPSTLSSRLALKRGIEPVTVMVLRAAPGKDVYLTDRDLKHVPGLPAHEPLVLRWPEFTWPDRGAVPDGRCVLLNAPGSYSGPQGRLSTLFRDYPPEGRAVEVYQGEAAGAWPGQFDLMFKGRVDEVSRQTEDELWLEIVGEAAWVYEQVVGRRASREEFPGLRPEHEGLPIWEVVGTVDRLPLTPVDIGGEGRLATAMTGDTDEHGTPIPPGPGQITVSNDVAAEDFPAGTHVIQIGQEQIQVSRSGDTFTVLTRGYNATPIQPHDVGDPVWEVRSAYDYAVAIGAVDSVTDVRADELLQLGGNWSVVVENGVTLVRFSEKPRTVKNLKPGLENSLGVLDTIGVDDGIVILDGVTVNDGITVVDGIVINDGIAIEDGITIVDGLTVIDGIAVQDGITVSDNIAVSATTTAHKSVAQNTTATLPATISVTSQANTPVHADKTTDFSAPGVTIMTGQYTVRYAVDIPALGPSDYGTGGYIRVYLKASSHFAGDTGGILLFEHYYDGSKLWKQEVHDGALNVNDNTFSVCLDVKLASAEKVVTCRVNGVERTVYGPGSVATTKTGSATKSGTVSKTGSVTRGGSVNKQGSVTRSGSVDRSGQVTKDGSVTKQGTVHRDGAVTKTGGVTLDGTVALIGYSELLTPATLITATVARGSGELVEGVQALAAALGVACGDMSAARTARSGYRWDYALAGERFGDVLRRLAEQSHCEAFVSFEGELRLEPVASAPGTVRRTFTPDEIVGPVVGWRTRRDELVHRRRCWYRRDYREGRPTLAPRRPRDPWAEQARGYLASLGAEAAGGNRQGPDAVLDLVRDEATAGWWLAEALARSSRPWTWLEFEAPLDAYALEPGDTVRVSWPGGHFTSFGAVDAVIERMERVPGSGRDGRLDRVRIVARILSDHE